MLTGINEKDDNHKICALLYNVGTHKADMVMLAFTYAKKAIPNPSTESSAP